MTGSHWDYLVITASNEAQAMAYRSQIALRQELGMLANVRDVLVLPDPDGRRVGSGGGTLGCLTAILHDQAQQQGLDAIPTDAWGKTLAGLRVLIVHAGGDSRRLPAYGPCGKLFVPVPGDNDAAVPLTLFDRQISTYLALGPGAPKGGQIVITAGDVLLQFDAAALDLATPGLVGLGALATPKEASGHGVYCADHNGEIRRFLQKPDESTQRAAGAINRYGQSVLDIGVMSFDAKTAVALLEAFDITDTGEGLTWTGAMGDAIDAHGLDFYREIACALGPETDKTDYLELARASGSPWSDADLGTLFDRIGAIRFCLREVSQCQFLHFGTTAQIATSGQALIRHDAGHPTWRGVLDLGNIIDTSASSAAGIVGPEAWVESCHIRERLELAGSNVLVGADIHQPVSLPKGACVDVLPGKDHRGNPVHFVRCYGTADPIKADPTTATFCHHPLAEWLDAVGSDISALWNADTDAPTLWDAKLFPAVDSPERWTDWLWMFTPGDATDEQKAEWRNAERFSLAEMAILADPEAFFDRRMRHRAWEIRTQWRGLMSPQRGLSAADIAHAWNHLPTPDAQAWLTELLGHARWLASGAGSREPFTASRLLHTLADALQRVGDAAAPVIQTSCDDLSDDDRMWLADRELMWTPTMDLTDWTDRLAKAAFAMMETTIVATAHRMPTPPQTPLRRDEIVWGRCPARVDFGGGWSDTPPYSIEFGGQVINAAIDLNGQPPIHCYGRLCEEPVIRIHSIDLGAQLEIRTLEELYDYRSATGEFSLAKAALAISLFGDDAANWPAGMDLADRLRHFGGGLELTTLAAIPKGSGLGTSSIVGAVILAVVHRMMGRALTHDEIVAGVLRIEQALTTGGGWQDQIGGVLPGVKVIDSAGGMTPHMASRFIPANILDPETNGGSTLLYFTGINRLAKDILHQIVGRYLSRDRATVTTLRDIHAIPSRVAESLQRKDPAAFGALVSETWRQNTTLDPNATNTDVESLLQRIDPYIHGAKLTGAGGGGFMLIVCKSPSKAVALRNMLEADPPNERARFFDFAVSQRGLEVTIC
jgi:fucokinase